MRVFVSYRRSDVGGYAGRLVDLLVARLGERKVFHDVTTIALGEDFTAAIDRALDDCDTVLAVIGPGWLNATTPAGAHRLTQPDDYVRLELTRALERGVPVVPVLVGGAALPRAGDLPAELRGLVERQGTRLHDETWHDDVEDLVRDLRGRRQLWRPPRRTAVLGVALLTLSVLATAVVLLRSDDDRTDRTSEEGYPGCVEPSGEGWREIALDTDPTGSGRFQDARFTFRVVSGAWRAIAPGRWQVTLATRMEHDDVRQDRPHGSWMYDSLSVGRMPFELSCITAEPSFVGPGLVGRAVIGFQVACDPAGALMLSVLDGAATIDVSAAKEPSRC